MCQVLMKLFGKSMDTLDQSYISIEHPIVFKRIADLQKQGYIYIKP